MKQIIPCKKESEWNDLLQYAIDNENDLPEISEKRDDDGSDLLLTDEDDNNIDLNNLKKEIDNLALKSTSIESGQNFEKLKKSEVDKPKP